MVPLSHNKLLTQMGLYTADLITSLDHFSDQQNTYNPVGQLEVAISEARWQDLKRLHGTAKAYGCETALLTPQEAADKLPLLDASQFVGALHVPAGMIIKGSHLTAALARDAEATGGAKFVGHTAMTDIEVKGDG